jgi:hypothetical protein
MKQILFTITTAVLFLTACNSEKKNNTDTEKRIVFTDTAALRLSNAATDKAASNELLVNEANQENTKPKVVTVIKYVNAPQKQRVTRRRANTPAQQAPSLQNNDEVSEAPSTGTAGTGNTNGGGNTGGEVASAPEVKKKKGWSDAAKGATIGGVGGAVAGAVISKKKGKGAIIGGVIGAAGGYILGRKADKKSGRAN